MKSPRYFSTGLLGLAFIVAPLVAFICPNAQAQVELVGFRKTGHFLQTSDAAPTVGDATTFFDFDVQLRTTGAGDVGDARLHGAVGSDHVLNQDGNTWSYVSSPFATSAALDAQFPTGPYSLSIAGGALGAQNLTPGDLNFSYPTTFSYLTGTSYSGLNQWTPSSGGFNLTFTGHIAPLSAAYSNTYLTFFDLTNDTRFDQWLNATDTSFLLNDAFFQDGHSYAGVLNPFDQYAEAGANVGIMNYLTEFAFTTGTAGGVPISPVPEPSTFSLIGAMLLFGVVGHRRFFNRARREQRRVEAI